MIRRTQRESKSRMLTKASASGLVCLFMLFAGRTFSEPSTDNIEFQYENKSSRYLTDELIRRELELPQGALLRDKPVAVVEKIEADRGIPLATGVFPSSIVAYPNGQWVKSMEIVFADTVAPRSVNRYRVRLNESCDGCAEEMIRVRETADMNRRIFIDTGTYEYIIGFSREPAYLKYREDMISALVVWTLFEGEYAGVEVLNPVEKCSFMPLQEKMIERNSFDMLWGVPGPLETDDAGIAVIVRVPFSEAKLLGSNGAVEDAPLEASVEMIFQYGKAGVIVELKTRAHKGFYLYGRKTLFSVVRSERRTASGLSDNDGKSLYSVVVGSEERYKYILTDRYQGLSLNKNRRMQLLTSIHQDRTGPFTMSEEHAGFSDWICLQAENSLRPWRLSVVFPRYVEYACKTFHRDAYCRSMPSNLIELHPICDDTLIEACPHHYSWGDNVEPAWMPPAAFEETIILIPQKGGELPVDAIKSYIERYSE